MYTDNLQAKRWLEYDSGSRRFSPTSFAEELEKRARLFNPFNTLPPQH